MSSLLNGNGCDVVSGTETLSFESYNTNLFEYFLDPGVEQVSGFGVGQNVVGDFLSQAGAEGWGGMDTTVVEEGSGVVLNPFYPGIKSEEVSPNGGTYSSDGTHSEPTSPDYETTILQTLGDNLAQGVNSGSSEEVDMTPEDLEGDESDEMLDDSNEGYETEEQGIIRRSRKRKAGEVEPEKLKGAANTKDLEEITKQIQEKRPLSNDEEQLFKRQRRLIKNRESAQKSRLRKKKYVEELELKVKSYADLNTRLIEENKNLKEDVGYLATVVRKTPNISNDVLKGVARRPAFSTANAKAAGVCLLLVLFSFGLFFNTRNGVAVGNGENPFSGMGNQTNGAKFNIPQYTAQIKSGGEVEEDVQEKQKEIDTNTQFLDKLEEDRTEGSVQGEKTDKGARVFRPPSKKRKTER
eukprot:TRINITY_DN4485_c0_g1_i2.p1 TRINITY_DN4485_c0_g1~~TRINITY_DN4485_c0_g1_i2.p1  ORF type:complete len:410 (+),score=128.42 TRINITY_DN4485_c0_g1_i2:167-1396(+)